MQQLGIWPWLPRSFDKPLLLPNNLRTWFHVERHATPRLMGHCQPRSGLHRGLIVCKHPPEHPKDASCNELESGRVSRDSRRRRASEKSLSCHASSGHGPRNGVTMTNDQRKRSDLTLVDNFVPLAVLSNSTPTCCF